MALRSDSSSRGNGLSGPAAAAAAVAPAYENVEACAARLDITAERVLRECRRIAFADIGQIVEWDADGIMRAKPGLTEDTLAAVAEIVASAATGRVYRIKMYDKKPVLELLARLLDLLPSLKPAAAAAAHDQEQFDAAVGDGEDPRELLARKIARIAAAGNPV